MDYKVGDIIEVTISAIQPYGAFAIVDESYTGLIHISEISSKFVKSIDSFVSLGSKVKVKVLEIDQNTKHVKLSLKALQRSREEKKTYRKPATVKNSILEFKKLEENLQKWIDNSQ